MYWHVHIDAAGFFGLAPADGFASGDRGEVVVLTLPGAAEPRELYEAIMRHRSLPELLEWRRRVMSGGSA
jgi:hypothetical protein